MGGGGKGGKGARVPFREVTLLIYLRNGEGEKKGKKRGEGGGTYMREVCFKNGCKD